MQLAHPESSFITPKQGFIGGIGLAFFAFLLLFSTGRIFGISGFIHGSVRASPTATPNDRRGNVLGVIGLILGGLCVGALEGRYSTPTGHHDGWEGGKDSAGFAPASAILTVAMAGLLSGIGSKLQNGCTSGHMILGISRFSLRSLVATLVFFLVASITAQFSREKLHPIDGYDWSLGPIGGPLLWIGGFTLKIAIVLLLIVSDRNTGLQSQGLKDIFNGGISLLSAFGFALALRLSTLNSPSKVLGFLITPFHDPRLFDPTLAFLAMGALPLSVVFWRVGNHLHAKPWPPQTPIEGDAKLSGLISTEAETEPLIAQTASLSPPRSRLPVLDNAWPNTTNITIDIKLIAGAVLFGVGWGMLGICPGPAILNFGISLYASRHGTVDPGLIPGATWLATFVAGGLIAA